MHRRLVVMGVGVVGVLVGLAVVFRVGMQRRSPGVVDAGRRATRLMRPFAMRTAGSEGAYASVIGHRGRRSGRPYETPVVAVQHEDGFLVALPYGPKTDWLQNVVAAGSATLRVDGRTHSVDHPEIISMRQAIGHFGPREQRLHRRYGVESCLQVHEVAS